MQLTLTDIQHLSLSDGLSKRRTLRWIKLLGVTETKRTVQNVQEALCFFMNRMSTLPPVMAFNFLSAMDLSSPVATKKLTKGTQLLAFRSQTECEFKLFYTRPGANPYSLGILANGRVAVQYEVSSDKAYALESRTTGTIDVWSVPTVVQSTMVSVKADKFGSMVSGGGIQLIIPSAERYLLLTNVGSHVHGDDVTTAARTQQKRNK